MRTMRRTAVLFAVLLLAGTQAFAEKLKGFLWEVSPQAIVVDGENVRLGPDT